MRAIGFGDKEKWAMFQKWLPPSAGRADIVKMLRLLRMSHRCLPLLAPSPGEPAAADADVVLGGLVGLVVGWTVCKALPRGVCEALAATARPSWTRRPESDQARILNKFSRWRAKAKTPAESILGRIDS